MYFFFGIIHSFFFVSEFFVILADDEPTSSCPQLPIKNMVFETKEDMRNNNKACKKLTMRKGSRYDSTRDRKNVAMENKNNGSSSWPNFQDEDYIVFCFREDGAFVVVKDCKSEALDRFDPVNKCPRSVNRKVSKNFIFCVAACCLFC